MIIGDSAGLVNDGSPLNIIIDKISEAAFYSACSYVTVEIKPIVTVENNKISDGVDVLIKGAALVIIDICEDDILLHRVTLLILSQILGHT